VPAFPRTNPAEVSVAQCDLDLPIWVLDFALVLFWLMLFILRRGWDKRRFRKLGLF